MENLDTIPGMNEVKTDLLAAAIALEPEIELFLQRSRTRLAKEPFERADGYIWSGSHASSIQSKVFRALRDLAHGSYWHFVDDLSELKNYWTSAKTKLYVGVAIELAKRNETGATRTGYSWIVEKYDDGTLREYVDDALLTEAVNRGFWEIVDGYLVEGTEALVMSADRFNSVMGHLDLLDFSRMGELHDPKLKITGKGSWVSPELMKAFFRASERMDPEQAGHFIRGKIAQIVHAYLEEDYPSEKYLMSGKNYLEEKLIPYEKYLATKQIQDLFRNRTAFCMRRVGTSYFLLSHLETLLGLLTCSEEEKHEFLSGVLLSESSRKAAIVMEGIPASLFTAEAQVLVADRLKEEIPLLILAQGRERLEAEEERAAEERCMVWDEDGFTQVPHKPIVPYLSMMQSAVQLGWLDLDWVMGQTAPALNDYLASTERPEAEAVEELLSVGSKEIIGQELYQAVVQRGVSDLKEQNRPDILQVLRRRKIEGIEN